MKHLHKDTVSSLLWNVFTVLLSVWAVSRPQWMGFTPAPCFHTSVLVVFWWYIEFYRTSFIEGRNFSQNFSKMLFGCLSIFYFLIISVIGTSNWEHRYQYLHKFPRKGCSNLYQSLTKTPKPKRGFFCVKVSIHLPSSISKVHGQRYVMHTNTWGMHCLGVLKSWAKGFWCFYSTHFYNSEIATCSYSGNRILEKEESAHFSIFCYFTNEVFKIFKTMLKSFLIKDCSVLTSPGSSLP